MKSILFLIILMSTVVLLIRCEDDHSFVNASDNRFLTLLIREGVDSDNNGKINPEEAEAVASLNVSEDSISELKGLEFFINLDTLICSNNRITALDVSELKNLVYLDCDLTSCLHWMLHRTPG